MGSRSKQEMRGDGESSTDDNQIVIHVCDESKQLKQDFSCPRGLLMREMRYFCPSNLDMNVRSSSQLQQQQQPQPHAYSSIPASALAKKSLDEIDISVHCDIFIFDWLMRYVKRDAPHLIERNVATPIDLFSDTVNNRVTRSEIDGSIISIEPRFELANAISILLSAEFLIMR